MRKVIPKKKNAFYSKIEKRNPDHLHTTQSLSSSPSFSSSSSNKVELLMGIAGKNINTGDVVMLDKNGLVVPFKGPEGRSNV